MTLAAITRLFLYLGAMIVVGDASLALGRRSLGASDRTEKDEAHALVLIGWTLALIATFALMLLQARDMELGPSIASLSILLSTTWGRGWLVLIAAAFVGTIVTVMRLPAALRTVAAFCLAGTMGGIGHAAADDAFPLLARVMDSLHVLSAGAWLGGLALVAWMQWRLPASQLRPEWESFSRIATIAAPLVVVTGAIAGWRRLQLAPLDQGAATPMSFAAAASSEYGVLLGAKLALVLVMLALGYTHRRRVLKEHAPSWTTVFTELALAVAVLVVTGVLTGTAPPGE